MGPGRAIRATNTSNKSIEICTNVFGFFLCISSLLSVSPRLASVPLTEAKASTDNGGGDPLVTHTRVVVVVLLFLFLPLPHTHMHAHFL